ncbi:MAG: hypothetical protein J0L61_08015, partial [Planctomycetes bacterium]|nr:hypothetical protein [Planctomycetota bacterium]
MDLATVRQIVNASPHGVVIRMVDGTRLRLPHRECVTLGPPLEDRPPDAPHRNMFVAADDEGFHFIDAGDVANVGTDTLTGVFAVVGSAFNDILRGSNTT